MQYSYQHILCLARVELQDNFNSPTSLLSELRWLTVNKGIHFKIATHAYQSLAFGQPTYLRYKHLMSLNGPSAKLIRICYLCHAATAFLDKEEFRTVPVKSGMTYHFQSDSPLHSTALSAT